MNGTEKGGNNRRFRHRRRDNEDRQRRERERKAAPAQTAAPDKNRGFFERPKWKAPDPPGEPIPAADCPYCGKPIRDISAALQDRASGLPVHFDCVIERIAEGEMLEPGDAVTYIGGGRFGVVHFNNLPDTRDFVIKKILEWEDKEHRAEWRKTISDHYSMT
jgi:hypothetical protein